PTSPGPIVPIQPEQPNPAVAAGPTRMDPPAPERPLPPQNLTPIAVSGTRPGVPPRDAFTATQDNVQPASATRAAASPPRPDMRNTQLINSTQITLGYDVTRQGPSGVRRAVLYLTEDDGRTWTEVGHDDLGLNKVSATLPGEGTFGFR